MSDIPDDLTAIGTHHGNEPPPDTGQSVRSPEGPDPGSEPVKISDALFQLIRDPDYPNGRLEVRTYTARAVVSEPDEGEEVGQYRTVEALREVLGDVSIEGTTAVFEDAEAGRFLVDPEVRPDHAWIGQARYPRITFFADQEAATQFVKAHV